MKAARIHGYGAEPVMEDVPVLEASLDQVLVRVKAAGLNPQGDRIWILVDE